MDRICQWTWDRYGTKYSWAICTTAFLFVLPVYLLVSVVLVALEGRTLNVTVVAVTVVGVFLQAYSLLPAGLGGLRLAEKWAAGHKVDRAKALQDTYIYARGAPTRGVAGGAVVCGAQLVLVGVIAGASGSRLLQYGILGAFLGASLVLTAVHSLVESLMRPARLALGGHTGIGDALPRSRPTFAAWSNLSVIAVALSFAIGGAMVAAAFEGANKAPGLWVLIGCGLTLAFAVPITVGTAFSPSLRPLRDLATGTERVAAGDYSQRVPVVQDDDLGALAASFNRMQAGLAERQRLQVAFGAYVDPVLAARLLEQGDDVFTGERREVSVMFVDVRDFTPFAEANTAEDTVARLNALFEIVVPAVVDAGGHVNKFLGDGALAVFGAPNDHTDHADAAVNAAVLIHRLVAERFRGALRIGIGINTGVVIAGTIGGGGHLEFTLIGDTTNVAARVEQLTKTTGDAILLTARTVEALGVRPAGLIERGSHVLKGKSAPVQVFGLDPPMT
ncbi:adenylate/guanylate cyclase domain-containing protein [Mycolicibacterium sphagni]|uniref:Adenylate/guanylate cyclase domain-containing protein n=1 Tax=Mycolicibacterium sphagni TaxID=1786 RepID=A0ABX2JRJ3_9MYCO|nr:adenylate/guanylate cyclase domain-containing protein [Mycolicibacterium sphagni]NTY58115.1 adenylate/guanylate cyclase domain-containing protein [Mycolicibacterium sphagni]